ncbi:aquaporin AQPAn.G-like [Vanessa atalanta]|uniref:aquaporin AQPAn.G-like n=1 Tax=Vanessa atalanta TaxID=42275 RepID=UPI001FCDC1C4|nr:aquaporin AQPAn.G-like [Vanessa atalanta]
MPTDDSERGLAAWLRRWWRPLVAEVVATALLVLLGVAALLPVDGKHPPLTHPAFAFGLVVLANVEAFGPTSGAHMNPSVTLAALLDGRIGPVAAAAYVVAQIFGATLGFGALMALAPDAFNSGLHVGGNAPGSVGVVAAAGVEALLTGVLALLCCAIWRAHDEGKQDPTVSIKFGLTIAGLVYAGGVMSSASLNPARSFGPALLLGFRSDHWVYWVGPLGGSALGTLLHRYVLRPSRAAPPRAEDLPLHDKADR